MGQISRSIISALVDFNEFNSALRLSADKLSADKLAMARETEELLWDRVHRSFKTHGYSGLIHAFAQTSAMEQVEREHDRREGAFKREMERRAARKIKLAAQTATA